MVSRKVLVWSLSFILVSSLSFAQGWFPPLLKNLSTSAVISGKKIYFDLDIVDTIGFFRAEVIAEVFYSTDNQSSWESVPTSLLGTTGYEKTWEGHRAISDCNDLIYYIRAKGDSVYLTASPKNARDLFPPPGNLLAQMADEPAGDARNTDKSFLDLTGFWMTYSDTRLYVKLTSQGDSWPFNAGVLGPWYFYQAQISNPDGNARNFYALMHCQLPPLFTPGLYKIDGSDTSVTRLGNIEVHQSGNTLAMSCNIADLVVDPDFGPWPPVSGNIIPIAATMTVSLSGGELNDETNICQYFPTTWVRPFGDNAPPSLSFPGVEFLCSEQQRAVLLVSYEDPDNDLPPTRSLYLDGNLYTAYSLDHSYEDASTFEYQVKNLGSGWHRYYFEFSDGKETVSSPVDSFRWSPVRVALRPPDRSIVIPPQGGQLRFDLLLKNNTTTAQILDAWSEVTLPNGNRYGPLAVQQGISLSPCQTKAFTNILQNLPGFAPSGEYSYRGYVGLYPDQEYSASSFTFAKSEGSAPPLVSDWMVFGWPGAEMGRFSLGALPDRYNLEKNFPNPFNTRTAIRYSLPKASLVRISVFNIRGQKVRTLLDSYQKAGTWGLIWEGRDDFGNAVSSGLYFYHMVAGDFAKTCRMILLK